MADPIAVGNRIQLQEYGEPYAVQASSLDLNALAQANTRWRRLLGLRTDPIRVYDVGDGVVHLRAEMVTGVVRVGRVDIEIAPKFLGIDQQGWQGILWQILTVVEGGYVDDVLTTAHNLDALSIPDLLAEIFLTSFARGASRGLPRRYQSIPMEGEVLRGALDTARLGLWLAQPWRIPYIADQLSEDTSLARLLRWSADTLADTVCHAGRARSLREIAASLSFVGRRPPHLLDAQSIALGTQHRDLESARIVGLLLLEGAGATHAEGQHSLSGFLWKSDIIYENYLFWLCQRAASSRLQRVEKRVAPFGELVAGRGRRLETTPDVVFRDASATVTAISDSKYKILGSRPKASDTYQILTAAHVLGCRKVSLTYPVSTPRKRTVWRVASALGAGDIELTAIPLNLMELGKPGGTQILVDSILDWLEEPLLWSEPVPTLLQDELVPKLGRVGGESIHEQESLVDGDS